MEQLRFLRLQLPSELADAYVSPDEYAYAELLIVDRLGYVRYVYPGHPIRPNPEVPASTFRRTGQSVPGFFVAVDYETGGRPWFEWRHSLNCQIISVERIEICPLDWAKRALDSGARVLLAKGRDGPLEPRQLRGLEKLA